MAEEFQTEFDQEVLGSIKVKNLEDEDFLLNTGERLVLKAEGCSLVLFYSTDNEVSRGLLAIWNTLADRLAGINFFAVNTSRRYDIMGAYEQIRLLPDHPFNKFTTNRRPFIWVFREALSPGLSIPKAIYNGELSSAAIQDWALMLACEPGYEEANDASQGGMDSNNNIYVEAEPINDFVPPVNSREFRSSEFNDRRAIDDALADLDARTEYVNDDFIATRPLPTAQFVNKNFRKRDPGFLAGFNNYQFS